ncbi:uncharacterized protein LOC144169704 [Haemaphysalis longicornis]
MSSSRAPCTMWTDDEILALLALVHEKKLSDLLDRKRQKNKDIFMDLERCLKKWGLQWTWEQIRTCWKNLKKRFTAERLLMCKSGAEPSKWKWLDKMNLLLGDRPMVQARDYGVDTAAEDEDSVMLYDSSEEEEGASDDLETCKFFSVLECQALMFPSSVFNMRVKKMMRRRCVQALFTAYT